jgi:hypothetical protein
MMSGVEGNSVINGDELNIRKIRRPDRGDSHARKTKAGDELDMTKQGGPTEERSHARKTKTGGVRRGHAFRYRGTGSCRLHTPSRFS